MSNEREELLKKAQEHFANQESKIAVNKFRFPTERVNLPSKGKYYTKPPLSEGYVEMKYMTAKEEDILSSANLIKQGIVIEKLIESLVVSEIDHDSLLIGDRNALVLAARILGDGNNYPVNITCPHCRSVEKEYLIDLNQFNHESVDLKDEDSFQVLLNKSELRVTYRLLRVKDSKEIDKLVQQYEKSNVNIKSSATLAQQIISIEDPKGDMELITDKSDILDYVRNFMLIGDVRQLKADIQTNTPDVDLTFDYICKNEDCKQTSELELSIGADFFWSRV